MYRWKVIYFFSWLLSILINRFRNPQSRVFKRILVIRHDEIGDMITALPVFDALKNRYPESDLTVWCYPLTKPLIENHPAISRVVTSHKELTGRYDLIVDLRGNARSLWYALVHFPYYRLDRGTIRLRNKFSLPAHPHEVFTNLQIVEPVTGRLAGDIQLKIHLGKRDYDTARTFLSTHQIQSFCLFHTGARKKLRRWPPSKFADLALRLKNDFGWEIVIAGTGDERSDIEKLQSLIPFRTYSFTGYTLTEFAALASQARCFVGNESGPMHIAAAVNIPVVGLFGPGEPHVFSPFGKQATFIHHKLKCNPCDQVHCVHPDNPCINLIEVGEVVQKVIQVAGPVNVLR